MTILTYIYEQQQLDAIGPITLAVNYMVFILSSLAAPGCKISYKKQMVFAAAAYTFNFSTGIVVPFVTVGWKYLLTVTGAAIGGASAGYLWVSQGGYLHEVCRRYGLKRGKYFGMFSYIYCLTNISAGLITTFGLGWFDAQIYFIILTAVGLLSIGCGLMMTDIQSQKIMLLGNVN